MHILRVSAAIIICALISVPTAPSDDVEVPQSWRPTRPGLATPQPPRFPGPFRPDVTSVVPTIETAETSVAAFVGATVSGPMDAPVSVNSFAQYQAQFGGLSADSPVSYAVRLFFDNGGTRAWIVRTDPASLPGGTGNATGIYALSDTTPLNVLCVPEVSDPAVLAAAEQFCRERRALLLIDPPADATPAEARSWLSGSSGPPRTRNCATYFPWLLVAEPGSSDARQCGPSGAVAGILARTDEARGVWKAPAGLEADLRGVSGLTQALTNAETASLNADGINPLRELSGGGPVVWGARTLSDDPQWRYVPVSRTALMIEESIETGTRWVISEPNEEPTWTRARQQVDGFLQDLWRRGALQGAKAEEAYFVRCGLGTTITPGDIAAGRMNILVGFAPLKPAEFIVLTISHHLAAP